MGPLERVALGLLAALAVWIFVSGLWGIPGTEAGHEAERALVYVAALAAFLFVVEPTSTKALLGGVLGGIVALSAYGLVDRVVRSSPPDPFEGSLLVGPVGYANALGILAGIGVILALGLLAIERRPFYRTLAAASAAILLMTLWLTGSRGASISAVCGLGVLIALYPRARQPRSRSRFQRVAIAAAVVLVVLAGVLAVARPSTTLGDRPAYWRAALRDARDHPLLGSGAGSFDAYWYAHRDVEANVRDAHSLYLEFLAELGPVGLALLVAALTAPFVAAARDRGSPITAVAAGGYSAFILHAGLDWDWEVPATTIAGLACGAALLAAARPTPSLSGP